MVIGLIPFSSPIMIWEAAVGFYTDLSAVATGRDPEDGDPLTVQGYLCYSSMLFLDVLPDGVGQAFKKIVDFRKTIGFSTTYTGVRSVDKVVALLQIDGHTFEGYNGWIGRTGVTLSSVMSDLASWGCKPNRATPTHAEGHVFYEALKAGITNAKTAVLYVDSTFCKSCGQNKGLRAFAKALGIEELTVYIRLPNGHVVEGLYDL
jgi:hypothetical protein